MASRPASKVNPHVEKKKSCVRPCPPLIWVFFGQLKMPHHPPPHPPVKRVLRRRWRRRNYSAKNPQPPPPPPPKKKKKKKKLYLTYNGKFAKHLWQFTTSLRSVNCQNSSATMRRVYKIMRTITNAKNSLAKRLRLDCAYDFAMIRKLN